MTLSRWSNVLYRVTTAGPYVNERLSILVLTFVVVAGISTVAYADKSVASASLAPLYFLPLALKLGAPVARFRRASSHIGPELRSRTSKRKAISCLRGLFTGDAQSSHSRIDPPHGREDFCHRRGRLAGNASCHARDR